jgi:hypothetical protein
MADALVEPATTDATATTRANCRFALFRITASCMSLLDLISTLVFDLPEVAADTPGSRTSGSLHHRLCSSRVNLFHSFLQRGWSWAFHTEAEVDVSVLKAI